MNIKKDFLELTLDELADYTSKGFALCYIEPCEYLDLKDDCGDSTHLGLRLFFTEADLKDQWGDNWDDAPYEHNSGWPYDDTDIPDGRGGWIIHEHTILVLNVTIPIEYCPILPLDYGGYNSPFSVKMINLGACAWMFFGDKCKPIYAGATPLDVHECIGKWLVPCPEVNWEQED